MKLSEPKRKSHRLTSDKMTRFTLLTLLSALSCSNSYWTSINPAAPPRPNPPSSRVAAFLITSLVHLVGRWSEEI